MKSMILLRQDNDRSFDDKKGMGYGSRTDEYVDIKYKRKKATQKNSWTLNRVSPMNTSDEESVHKSDSCTCEWKTKISENKSEVVLQNMKLRRELYTISKKVVDLEKEKCALRERVEGIHKARATEDARTKDKLDSLEHLVEERNRQVKELWDVIQMLDDENMVLKKQSDIWEEREKQLNKVIIDSKVSFANGSISDDIVVSYNAADWKEVLDQELSTWGSRNLKGQRNRDQVLKKKISVSRGRYSQSGVNAEKSSKQIIAKTCFTVSQNTKPVNNLGIEKEKSAVEFPSEYKLPVNMMKETENERVRNYTSDWNKEEVVIQNQSDKNCSTWGSGLWPPEWTTVPTVHQQKKWCPAWEAKE